MPCVLGIRRSSDNRDDDGRSFKAERRPVRSSSIAGSDDDGHRARTARLRLASGGRVAAGIDDCRPLTLLRQNGKRRQGIDLGCEIPVSLVSTISRNDSNCSQTGRALPMPYDKSFRRHQSPAFRQRRWHHGCKETIQEYDREGTGERGNPDEPNLGSPCLCMLPRAN